MACDRGGPGRDGMPKARVLTVDNIATAEAAGQAM
jgi:hypothetical protein